MSIRVLIVEDHGSLRYLLRTVLEDDERFEVVGEAANGREAVAEAERLQPDVVVLDLHLPKQPGLRALPEVRRVAPQAGVVVFTGDEDARVEAQALAEGAAACLRKGGDVDVVVSTIARVGRGAQAG